MSCHVYQLNRINFRGKTSRIINLTCQNKLQLRLALPQTATHSQPAQTPCDKSRAHCAGTGTGTAASFPQACCSGSCADEKSRRPRATARVQSGGSMHESHSTGSRRSRQRRFQSDAGAASLCWNTCTAFLYHFASFCVEMQIIKTQQKTKN